MVDIWDHNQGQPHEQEVFICYLCGQEFLLEEEHYNIVGACKECGNEQILHDCCGRCI